MEQIILIIHLLVALSLIGLILLQRGKGSDIGASFGAGASQTLFGSAGSGNALTRITAWLSAIFFVTSFALAISANKQTVNEDELGFDIPENVQVEQLGIDLNNDLPSIENMNSNGDLPLKEAPRSEGD